MKKLIKRIIRPNVSASVPQEKPKLYERSKVLDILKMIKPGIANKDLVESMKYFFISGMEIVAYNDRISIQYPFKTSFSAFIKANTFYNLMAKSTVEKISLERFNDTHVIVTGKGLRVKLPVVVDNEVANRIKIISKSIKTVKWSVLPENFKECINLCSLAASKSESESTLSCVKISKKTCIASDNNRIAVADMKKSMKDMFIKATEIKNLIGIDPTLYAVAKSWLHFKNEAGCIFSIRKMDGAYPNFLPHFDFDGARVDLPADISEGTNLASIFTSEDEQPSIEIVINKNKCFLTVKTVGGSLDFLTAIKYEGKRLQFTINPDFLLEMMKHTTTIVITEGKAKLQTENFSLLTSLYQE